DWVEVVTIRFPSGRSADEIVPRDAATLVWMVHLGCLELHPHPVRAEDLDHPDELRVDLDPVPGVGWSQVQQVARIAGEVLQDFGMTGWPKTSGKRGMHVLVRIEQRWGFDDVRRAALAFARQVERRAPKLATSAWWKEERHGVFVDYNQNAKDRTVASAYSVRPTREATVSAPLSWDEVAECEPGDFTMANMPDRFAELGDRHEGIDDAVCSIEPLLELADRQAADGLGDAPWPPHYSKQEGEPPRAPPSKRKARGGADEKDYEQAPRETLTPGDGAGGKDLVEVVGAHFFELIVPAVAGLLVGAPADECRAMPKAIPLQMIVLHLADALEPKWLPRKVLAGTPTAFSARRPHGLIALSEPGVILLRIRAERGQLRSE